MDEPDIAHKIGLPTLPNATLINLRLLFSLSKGARLREFVLPEANFCKFGIDCVLVRGTFQKKILLRPSFHKAKRQFFWGLGNCRTTHMKNVQFGPMPENDHAGPIYEKLLWPDHFARKSVPARTNFAGTIPGPTLVLPGPTVVLAIMVLAGP